MGSNNLVKNEKVQTLPDVELVASEERIVFSISYEKKNFEQDVIIIGWNRRSIFESW